MNRQPTYCVLFESISGASAIAKGAKLNVRIMLDAGWRVTVVTKFLDPELRGFVEWIPLYVPPRLYALQWLTARWFYRRALGNRTFDVIHAHQPQTADLADVYQCHFLTRVAYERKCLRSGEGLRGWIGEVQAKLALPAEDYYYRNWNPKTLILFNSELTRQEFARLYQLPPLQDVYVKGCPPLRLRSAQERAEARRKLLGDEEGLVVGYLGGIQERKGYRRLLEGLRGAKDIILLMGGSHGGNFHSKISDVRSKFVGLVENTNEFFAACDLFIVPSLFEPLGMVVFEAAARGLPVICTREVGALPHLLECGAGEVWDPIEPLAPLVRRMVADRASYLAGIAKLANQLSEARYAERLLAICDAVLTAKRGRGFRPRPPGSTGDHPTSVCNTNSSRHDALVGDGCVRERNLPFNASVPHNAGPRADPN